MWLSNANTAAFKVKGIKNALFPDPFFSILGREKNKVRQKTKSLLPIRNGLHSFL